MKTKLMALGIAVFASAWAVCGSATVSAAACVSDATGSWSTATTWNNCNSGIPGPSDSVSIASGHTITVDSDASAASLVLDTNSDGSGNSVEINSGVALVVSGEVSLAAPTAATTSLIVGNGSLQAGNLVIHGGTGNRSSTVSVSTGSVSVTGNISFGGSSSNARYTSSDASQTNVGGNFESGGTLTTNGTGTITFNGASAQTLGSYITYNNVVIANTGGGVSFTDRTDIQGTLNVNTGTLDINGHDLTVSGKTTINSAAIISSILGLKSFNDLTVASTGTLTLTESEGVTIKGDLVVDGTITGNTGTWSFQKSGGGVISGTGSLRLIAATFTFNTNYSINLPARIGTLAVNGTTLTNNSVLTASVTLTGTGQLKQGPNSRLNIGNTVNIASLDASAPGNSVHYIRTLGPQTVRPINYQNLSIDKPAQTATLGGPITVNGNLAITAGRLDDGGYQISGNNTGSFTMAPGTKLALGSSSNATAFPTNFTAGNLSLASTSIVFYGSNQPQTISNAPEYGDLATLSTTDVTKTAAGNLIVRGSFSNGTDNTFDNNGHNVTVQGNSIMHGPWINGTLILQGGSATHLAMGRHSNVILMDAPGLLLDGNLQVNGDLSVISGTLDTNNYSLRAAGQTTIQDKLLISGTNGTQVYGNVEISGSGTFAFNAAEDVAIEGDLTVDGAITGNTGEWTFSKSGGIINGSAASVTIAGTTNFLRNYTITIPLNVQTMLVASTRTVTNQSNILVSNSLAGSGQFTQGAGRNLSLGGDVSITQLQATAGGNIVAYTGGAGQTIKPTIYYILDLSTNTGNAVSTADGTSITDTLLLGATKLSVANGTVLIGPSAAVARTSGYVIGSVEKEYTANGAFTFPVGDTNNYAPIDTTLSGVSNSGSVIASSTPGKQPDTLAGLALIEPTQGINRTWSLTNNGVSFNGYDAVFHFAVGDIDAGANPSQMIVVSGANGVGWNQVIGFCGGLTCSASGQTLGDFQAGIKLVPTIPGGQNPTVFTPTPTNTSTPLQTTPLTTTAGTITTLTGPTDAGAPDTTPIITVPNPTTPNPTSAVPLFDVGAEISTLNQNQLILLAILIGLIVGTIIALIVIGIRKRMQHSRDQQQ